MKTQAEIISEEQIIADYVQALYAKYQPADPSLYDEQGIYTKYVAETGMTLHFFSEDYIQGPPLRHMLDVKIRSLAAAAKKLYPAQDKKINDIAVALSDSIALGELNAKNIGEMTEALLQKTANEMCLELYRGLALNKKPKVDVRYFIKQLMHAATHLRVDDAHTLTFDQKSKHFSLDIVNTAVTAHDRGLDKTVANLSVVYDGTYTVADDAEIKARVTSSVVKHASLAPLDAISGTRLTDLFESDMDVLVATCNHIEEVANVMVDRRLPDAEKTINLTYQMLTTNALNIEKQASSYGYTINAMNLMQGAELADGFTLNMHVFNAGINALAHRNLGQKADTQRRENRKAYLQMNKQFQPLLQSLPDVVGGIKQHYTNILKNEDAMGHSHDIQLASIARQFKRNAEIFNRLRAQYNDPITNNAERQMIKKAMGECLLNAKAYNAALHEVTSLIEKQQKAEFIKRREQIKAALEALRHGDYVVNLKNELTQGGAVAEKALSAINQLSGLYYKFYMDELYYSGDYRLPEKAVLFNAYMTAYQRLVGGEASIGCKSANDRTYVSRLTLAVMEGRDLQAVTLPEALHRDQKALKAYKERLAETAMSNSAMYSAINDTNGGAPKVDKKKFSILALIPAMAYLGKLGRYAAHKLCSSKAIQAIVRHINSAITIRTRKDHAGMFAHAGLEPRKTIRRSAVAIPRPKR